MCLIIKTHTHTLKHTNTGNVTETDPIHNRFITRFKNWAYDPFAWPCKGHWVRQICNFGVGEGGSDRVRSSRMICDDSLGDIGMMGGGRVESRKVSGDKRMVRYMV